MSSSSRAHLIYSSRSLTANPHPRGQAPNLETLQEVNSSTGHSEHVHCPEDSYYDEATGIRLDSRPVLYSSGSRSPNHSHLALDHQFGSKGLPDLPIVSGASSQPGGGSRPSTAGSIPPARRPPPPPSPVPISLGKSMHTRDNSTWSSRRASSSTSFSENSLPSRQQFGRHDQFLDPGSYRGSTDNCRQGTPTFDSSSGTSTKSSLKTSVSALFSRLSVKTSITSFSSGRSRVKAPKLDLEIPSHSLSMGTLLSGSSQTPSAKSSSKSNQGVFQRTSETSRQTNSVYITVPQHLLAGPSRQATSTSLDRNHGTLRIVAEASTQTRQNNSTENDPLQNLSPIEQAIQSPLRTFHDVDGVVTSGTLEGLVEFLITRFNLPGHTYYRDTFLTACSELTTPEDLFQILSRRLSEEQHTSDDGVATQYTILIFIVFWLKSNCFSPNEELLYRIKFFCEESGRLYPSLDSIAKETSQLITFKVAPTTALRTSNPLEPVLKSHEIKPCDLAVALGLLEGDNYKALQPSDYLLHLSKGQSDRVKVYHRTNEKIRLWVIRSILHFDTISDRSEVMKFYINTAFECLSMRNFSSTVAISNALHSESVEKLKVTRKGLSKRLQANLSALYEITHPQSNHHRYHDAIHAVETVQERDTCIPWLALHLKELDKVVRQPLTVQVDSQHLVCFTRYNRFMDRTKEILHYSPPNLEDRRHGGELTYLSNQLRDIDVSGELERQLLTKSTALNIRESSFNLHDQGLQKAGFKVPTSDLAYVHQTGL